MGSTWDPTPHKGAEWLATDGALCIVGPDGEPIASNLNPSVFGPFLQLR